MLSVCRAAPAKKKAEVSLQHSPDFLLQEDAVTDPKTGLRSGGKSGMDYAGAWSETWTETASGEFLLDGHNAEGHKWGERYGIHANGTTFKEKWLIKEHEGYEERSGWTSDGQTTGMRQGRTEDGKTWTEGWRQVLDAGITKGILTGCNEHGEEWKEEWEVVLLDAFDAETGEQLTSTCGEKSGTDREGMKWSQSWGADDVHGRWGTKSEIKSDGTEYTEHWGANLEGDIWCEKWGVTKCELGVSEEWGLKCGQKNVRIGQEMDGFTNMEEGKIETWTEQWCKTFEDDGRLARTQAEKIGELQACI